MRVDCLIMKALSEAAVSAVEEDPQGAGALVDVVAESDDVETLVSRGHRS